MKHDIFLTYLYKKSNLSGTTQKIYMDWVSRCCKHYGISHLLDVSPQQLEAYRLYLITDRQYSPRSDTIVYNAFKHTFAVLLPLVDNAAAQKYVGMFDCPPRQPHALPRYVDKATMQQFLEALPKTVAGYVIKEIYRTSRPFEQAVDGWKCSREYAAQVCCQTARKVGISHGFGLTGVQGVSVIHRIQARKHDLELITIKEDCGLSAVQFLLYTKAAGV